MPERFWLRHDLHIVAACALVLAFAWLLRDRTDGLATRPVALAGVTVTVPASWMVDAGAGVARGEDAITRVDVRVEDPPPPQVTLDAALELERGRRYGDVYQRTATGNTEAAGRTWLRTTYAYAFKPSATHTPRVASAVEYACAGGAHVYVVTLHGATEERVKQLEPVVFHSIQVAQ